MERGQREVMAGRERRAEEVRAKRVTLREVFRGNIEYDLQLFIIFIKLHIISNLKASLSPNTEDS